MSGLLSFDGGGFTGNGPRSGGMDGQGGFLAMMHPQETVTDHSKGGSGGGSVEIIVRSEPGVIVEIARNEATNVVGQSAPVIVRQSVAAVADRMNKSQSFGNNNGI